MFPEALKCAYEVSRWPHNWGSNTSPAPTCQDSWRTLDIFMSRTATAAVSWRRFWLQYQLRRLNCPSLDNGNQGTETLLDDVTTIRYSSPNTYHYVTLAYSHCLPCNGSADSAGSMRIERHASEAYSGLFSPQIVSVGVGYCCTWSQAMTHTH